VIRQSTQHINISVSGFRLIPALVWSSPGGFSASYSGLACHGDREGGIYLNKARISSYTTRASDCGSSGLISMGFTHKSS